MIKKLTFYIPTSLNIAIIKNHTLWLMIYSSHLTCITQTTTPVFFNPTTRIIIFYNLTVYIQNVINLIKNTSLLHTVTLKFKGKGYKLTKNKHLINLKFNFAHPQYLIPRVTSSFKNSKNRITLLNSNYTYLKILCLKLLKIRNVNIYTKNGLRFKKQILYRRKGKTLNT